MASRFERRTGVVCHFRSDRETLDLPAGVPLVAYRTAQEALTNVTKHAGATQVSIDLTVAAGTLTLEIGDNGRGLDRDDLTKARSFGIRGLHERASTVGGWVDLSSSARGTTLILSVPLPPADVAMGAAPAQMSEPAIESEYDPSTWGAL